MLNRIASQSFNSRQYFGKYLLAYCYFCHLKRNISAVSDNIQSTPAMISTYWWLIPGNKYLHCFKVVPQEHRKNGVKNKPLMDNFKWLFIFYIIGGTNWTIWEPFVWIYSTLYFYEEGGKKVLFHSPCNEIYIVCCCQWLVNQGFALTLDSSNPKPDSFKLF